jgi:RNA polymerase sigma factor (sigma-70 family)
MMTSPSTNRGDLASTSAPQARDFSGYEGFLVAVARRSLGRSLRRVSEASDFVQETFLAAGLAELKGQGPPPVERREAAWLRTILRRKIAEAVRRQDYEINGGGIEIGPIIEAIEASATTPSGALRRKIRVEAVQEALEKLSPRSRQVLVWQIGYSVTCKEIGERLGISGTYVSRIRDSALEQLKLAYTAVGGPVDFS